MWKVINCVPKFNEDYTVIEFTEIQISKDSPYSLITGVIKGDFTKELDENKVELVLEDFYQRTYHSRAENEKIRRIDENLAKTEKMIEKVESRIDLIQKALLEFTLGVSIDEDNGEDAEEDQEDVK